jgi:hypothetical protein
LEESSRFGLVAIFTVKSTTGNRLPLIPPSQASRPTFLTANTNANIQSSIRGRVGIAWDRALISGTRGAA